MKILVFIFVMLCLASCCPYSLFAGKQFAAEPNIEKLCGPILAEETVPGMRLDGELKVMGDWAFFMGDTVDASGEAVTPPNAASSDSVVLFRRLDGQWRVVEHGIGISDAYYFGWHQTHDLPEGLLEP